MTGPWIAALVVLWAVVIVTLFILLGLLRRVTSLFDHDAVHPRSDQVDMQSLVKGLPIGEHVPAAVIETPEGAQMDLVVPGIWNLVVLISVACSHCRTLVSDLAQTGSLPEGVRTVFVIEDTDAGREFVSAINGIAAFQIGDAVGRALDTSATPYGFLVDPEGVVRARSHPNNAAALESLTAAMHSTNGAQQSHAKVPESQ